MPDYRMATVTAVVAATGMCTVTDDSGASYDALALGDLPAVGWVVWIEMRGSLRSDWVIVDVLTPPGGTPGQLIATSTGNNSITSGGTGAEVMAAASTAGLGLASVWLSSLRPYRVEIVGRANQLGTAAMIITIRASTGTVTTSSTLITRAQFISAASGTAGAFDPSIASPPWTPASTGTWNLAIGAAGASSAVTSWGPIGAIQFPTISIYAA